MSTKLTSKRNRSIDWPLFFILLTFNIWSGGTTILGAQQILPNNLAVAFGVTTQFMLFFLLSGWVMRHSLIRKWIAVLVFTSISIYTSFFCYYDLMTSDVRQRDTTLRAIDAHQVMITTIYTPLVEKLRQLESEVDRLNSLARQECEVGITTGIVGCGPQHRSFLLQASEKESEMLLKKNLVDELGSLLSEYSPRLRQMSPEEIYVNDQVFVQSVPSNYLNSHILKFEDYIDRSYDVELLTPYYKAINSSQRDATGVFSLILAVFIDGVSVIQATAIDKKAGKLSFLSEIYNQRRKEKNEHKIYHVNKSNAHSQLSANDSANVAESSTQEDLQEFQNFVRAEYKKLGRKSLNAVNLFDEVIKISPPHLVSTEIDTIFHRELILFAKNLIKTMRYLGWIVESKNTFGEEEVPLKCYPKARRVLLEEAKKYELDDWSNAISGMSQDVNQ